MDKPGRGKGNARRRRRAKAESVVAAPPADAAAAFDVIGAAETAGAGAGETAVTEPVGHAAIANDGLAEMLDRVTVENLASEQQAAPAPLAITVESFPGLCMGASMLASLSLHKIGFEPLTPDEGKQLAAALLKNAQAWDLSEYMGNPKVAAALDLAGVGIAILVPRVVADAERRRPKSQTQQSAADNAAQIPAAA